MKTLNELDKVFYINELDKAIAEYEIIMRLLVTEYQYLKGKRFSAFRPFLRRQMNQINAKYIEIFNKHSNIKKMRYLPLSTNSNK